MGHETDSVMLTRETLDATRALALVMDPDAGGISTFVGTTRAESGDETGTLTALEYHAYEEMALAEMHRLVAAARRRWGLCRCAVHHRMGRCAVGEISVVIAVSCPHRAAAFEACRFLIDQLKRTVPIWKKDLFGERGQWRDGPR